MLVVSILLIETATFVGASGGYNNVATKVASIDDFHPPSSAVPSLSIKRQANLNYDKQREHSSLMASQLGDNLYARHSNTHDSINQYHSHQSDSEDLELNPVYPHADRSDDDDRLIDPSHNFDHGHDSQQGKHQHFGPFDDKTLPSSNTSSTRSLYNYNDEIEITSEHTSYHEYDSFDVKTNLTEKLINDTCKMDRGSQRMEKLNGTYLTFCSRYKSENLLSNEILMSIMHHDSQDCRRILKEFIQLDETINQFDDLFTKLLSRYNCHNGYSVKWNCDDCKRAYKDWLCATHLPYYMNGERIKPCISFCERVEQRCPYLHPITREQYGGQPVFICRDPNIPFVPEITPDIPCSEPGKCYDLCHLSDNLTELIIDSLSKYDYDKCPDKSSIASEVRSEQSLTQSFSNGSKFLSPSSSDSIDYRDESDNNNNSNEDVDRGTIIANRTTNSASGHTTQVLIADPDLIRKKAHVHSKKLEELREVLANYKNQAKTHRYHADHSSIDQGKSLTETH